MHHLDQYTAQKNIKIKTMLPSHKISVIKQKNKTNLYMKDYEGKNLGFEGEVACGYQSFFDMGTRNQITNAHEVIPNTQRSNYVEEQVTGYYSNGLCSYKINEGCHYVDRNGRKVSLDIFIFS